MKIETREDALLHCFDLWLWLAVTGSPGKDRWPGWEKNGGHLESCLHDCPVCGHSRQICSHCIIKWKKAWCDDEEAEYGKWTNAESKQERTKYALEIAALALDAL